MNRNPIPKLDMVLPINIKIKEEKEDYEYVTFVESACDVEVKIEPVRTPEVDFSVRDKVYYEKFQLTYDQNSEVVDYEELTEYGLQICDICKQMFQDYYSLLCHKLIHLEVQLVPIKKLKNHCIHCLKNFKDKLSLHYHIKQECQKVQKNNINQNSKLQKNSSSHQCHICSKVYSYSIWFDHMNRVHSNQCYQCDICKRQFKAKAYLRRHIMFVHQAKEYLATKSKNTHHRQQANKHPIKKFGIFKCSLCPAVFPHITPLNLHIKNCHCEKVRCDKCFSVLKKSYLANHIRRVHYDDGKEHKCECGKKFKSPRYLKIHIKNSHNKRPSLRVKKRQTHHIASEDTSADKVD